MADGVRAFAVWIVGRREHSTTINASTAGKAKYEAFLDWRDPHPDLRITDMRSAVLGPARTSPEFARNASYRGMPEARCGDRVEVRCGGDVSRGYIVGHNSSANFDIQFDADCPVFKGGRGNVHPSELRIIK